MAAKTPSAVVTENLGSNTLYKVSFTDIDIGDTYESKILSATSYWCNGTDTAATTKEGIDVGYSQTTGVFTFSSGENNRTGDLYILAKA